MKSKLIIEKKKYASNLSQTLMKLMQLHQINMNQLHKHTHIPLTTINRLVNDEHINPTFFSLLPIANYFKVTLNQLMGLDPIDTEALLEYAAQKRDLWTHVPIISWSEVVDWPKKKKQIQPHEWVSTDITLDMDAFGLKIPESNWEGFLQNAMIIVNPNLTPVHRDYAVTCKSGHLKASLKQILIEDGVTYLKPVNKDYQTQIFDDTFKISGVVMQVRKDMR